MFVLFFANTKCRPTHIRGMVDFQYTHVRCLYNANEYTSVNMFTEVNKIMSTVTAVYQYPDSSIVARSA